MTVACKEISVQFTPTKEAIMCHRRKSFSENVNGNFKKERQCSEIKEEVEGLLEMSVQPTSYVPKLFSSRNVNQGFWDLILGLVFLG